MSRRSCLLKVSLGVVFFQSRINKSVFCVADLFSTHMYGREVYITSNVKCVFLCKRDNNEPKYPI